MLCNSGARVSHSNSFWSNNRFFLSVVAITLPPLPLCDSARAAWPFCPLPLRKRNQERKADDDDLDAIVTSIKTLFLHSKEAEFDSPHILFLSHFYPALPDAIALPSRFTFSRFWIYFLDLSPPNPSSGNSWISPLWPDFHMKIEFPLFRARGVSLHLKRREKSFCAADAAGPSNFGEILVVKSNSFATSHWFGIPRWNFSSSNKCFFR